MKSIVGYLFPALITLLIAERGESRAQGDLDTLIGEVFGNQGANGNTEYQPKPEQPDQQGGQSTELQPNTGSVVDPLQCECVPYYLCMNNTIITDGVGLIDIRIKEGPCKNYLDVCCQKPNIGEQPVTPKPLIRTGCGRRNPEGVGFRIKGDEDNEAQFGEFPWMVAILREEPVDKNPAKLNVYQCGGSLIHPQVVLTAAHCIINSQRDPHSLKVRVGEWDTQTKNELFPYQERYVKSVVIHPEYNRGALFNDIGLLFLESPVEYADNVDVICLPDQGAVFDYSKCLASGWGKDTFGKEGRYQVILKKVELPVIPREQCVESLHKTRLGPYFNLHKSFICAGGEEGKDTCKGDGGGPLVCPIPSKPDYYQQVGIVSWGIGCGENKTPGVYANVPMFRDWVDEQIAYEGLPLQ